MSKLVSDLESHLGIKLLNRTTRVVAATADGLAYYPRAAQLISELDAMDSDIRGSQGKPSGHLRLHTPGREELRIEKDAASKENHAQHIERRIHGS